MNIVILAAGQGKRMKSALPKVLQLLAGKPLIAHVLQTVNSLSPKIKPIIVIGHGAVEINAFLEVGKAEQPALANVVTVIQKEQKGTGHALLQALSKLEIQEPTLVLYGDVPLISKKTLMHLSKLADGVRGSDSALALLTQNLLNPTGYGRKIGRAHV